MSKILYIVLTVLLVFAPYAQATFVDWGGDLQGNELIFDADADTSITADTDDTMDFRFRGTDIIQITDVQAADNATTDEVFEIYFTSPVNTTGTNTLNAFTIDLAIGNATGGTNTVSAIQIDAITGDAQVTLNGINIGALTGTGATEYAINIASGWDRAISIAGGDIVTEGDVTLGDGGTVTQATNKSTGVTLNTHSGQITMNGAALAAGAEVGFTLTNSVIAATDVVIVNIASGATADSYTVTVDAVAAGSCRISLSNVSAGSLSEAVVLNFVVIGGASS